MTFLVRPSSSRGSVFHAARTRFVSVCAPNSITVVSALKNSDTVAIRSASSARAPVAVRLRDAVGQMVDRIELSSVMGDGVTLAAAAAVEQQAQRSAAHGPFGMTKETRCRRRSVQTYCGYSGLSQAAGNSFIVSMISCLDRRVRPAGYSISKEHVPGWPPGSSALTTA